MACDILAAVVRAAPSWILSGILTKASSILCTLLSPAMPSAGISRIPDPECCSTWKICPVIAVSGIVIWFGNRQENSIMNGGSSRLERVRPGVGLRRVNPIVSEVSALLSVPAEH